MVRSPCVCVWSGDVQVGDEASGVEEWTIRRNEVRRGKRAISVFTLGADFILLICLNGIARICHPSWMKGGNDTRC